VLLNSVAYISTVWRIRRFAAMNIGNLTDFLEIPDAVAIGNSPHGKLLKQLR